MLLSYRAVQYYWLTNILQYFLFPIRIAITFFRIAIPIVFYPLFPLISNLFKYNIFSLEIHWIFNENLILQQLSFKIYFTESKHMTVWLYIEIRVCERPKTESET